jgi:hypothetical protein
LSHSRTQHQPYARSAAAVTGLLPRAVRRPQKNHLTQRGIVLLGDGVHWLAHSALPRNPVTRCRHADRVSARDPFDDPVPSGVVLSLDEAFRVLEAIEDARLALRQCGAAPGLQDELATVIRMLHGKLGIDEGGVQ